MSLYFCHDGILRTQDPDKRFLSSLSYLQNQEGFEDFPFLAAWWNEPVLFEKGLTLTGFFKCIEPWAEFWGIYLQRDIQAYCREIRKPILVSKQLPFDWISLDYQTEFYPEVVYPLDTNEKATLQNNWRIHSSYELSAYSLGTEKQNNISHHSLQELSHLPFILNPYQTVIIDEFFTKSYGKDNSQLLNPQGLGVLHLDDEMTPFAFIQGNKHHSLKELLEGFFAHFDYSPENRDEVNSKIEESIEASFIPGHEPSEEQWSMLEEVFLEHRSLVDDFNPIDTDYYRDLFLKAKTHSQESDLRIGAFHVAEPLEKRLLSWIIKK